MRADSQLPLVFVGPVQSRWAIASFLDWQFSSVCDIPGTVHLSSDLKSRALARLLGTPPNL